MTDISADETIWYPGLDYKGRTGVYAQPAHTFKEEKLVEYVQRRAQEDGDWAIAQGFANKAAMHKMMEWVSRPENIKQCAQANLDMSPTIDDICRELAQATQRILSDFGTNG